MTDEYPRHTIEEFIGGGCKNYGMKLRAQDGTAEYVKHCRGITLDYKTDQRLSYEEMKRRILNIDRPEQPLVLNYNMLRPSIKKGEVHTQNLDKIYKPIITKGMILEDLRIVPFGYQTP